MPPFDRFGPGHLGAIAVTLLVPCLLAWWTRADRSGLARRCSEWVFVVVLVGAEVWRPIWRHRLGELPPWPQLVPLHLCDWALWACVIGCLSRRRLAYICAYFWGLAGTLQGLITPDLATDFPTVRFLLFFMGHGGIVGCVLYFVASGMFRPDWGSVRQAYVGLLIYGLVAGTYNAIVGTNYGYTCAKPAVSSLLDYLGPWPWYVGALLLVAAVNFTALYLPWVIAERIRATRRQHDGRRTGIDLAPD